MRMKKRTPSGVLFLWLFEHKTLSPRPLSEGVLHNRGASRHRHLERSCMPLWGADGNRAHDALSREISQRNAARTIRGGDFSTPLRFGRNDERDARHHRHLERRIYEKIVSRCFILPPA